MKTNPNILFIITDQQNADCLGFMGHPMVKTPNLDRLAARGVWANRMFSSCAVCGPSRASFATGMYLRGHGQFGNHCAMNHPYPSLPGELRKAGYVTALAGKSHFESSIEKEFEHRWDMDLYGEEVRKHGWDYKDFDDRMNKEFQAGCSKIPEEWQNEVWTANRAIDFLREHEGDTRPFFLWCSFDRPHCPHTPPETFDDLYDPDAVPVDWEGYAAFEAGLMQNRPMIEDFWKIGSVRHDVKIFQKAVCRYLALIALIDREAGRILDELERLGMDDETIVIFTSDHGDFAGRWGQLGKNLPAYDPLLRIPFIWVDPARPADAGRCVERLMQNVDVFPTLMERLGLETPPTVQGESSLYLFEGAPGADRRYIYAETWMEKTIRSKDWKLTFFARHPERGQLFRMGAVPDEVNNLWDEPAHREIRERLLRDLIFWMVACEQPSACAGLWESHIDTRWNRYLGTKPSGCCGLKDYREFLRNDEVGA